jgi:hypothetical protein
MGNHVELKKHYEINVFCLSLNYSTEIPIIYRQKAKINSQGIVLAIKIWKS